MIIVDTTVWVDHFRKPDQELAALIAKGGICLHPFVHGELMLGGLPAVGVVAEEMMQLPCPPIATVAETLAFINWAGLAGTGVGYVDAHLLISARLLRTGKVMTRDKRLVAEARRLGIAYDD